MFEPTTGLLPAIWKHFSGVFIFQHLCFYTCYSNASPNVFLLQLLYFNCCFAKFLALLSIFHVLCLFLCSIPVFFIYISPQIFAFFLLLNSYFLRIKSESTTLVNCFIFPLKNTFFLCLQHFIMALFCKMYCVVCMLSLYYMTLEVTDCPYLHGFPQCFLC